MLASISRILARLVGKTGRALGRGGPGSRLAAICGIVALLVASTSVGISAITQLASAALVLAGFVVIYSLILRGR